MVYAVIYLVVFVLSLAAAFAMLYYCVYWYREKKKPFTYRTCDTCAKYGVYGKCPNSSLCYSTPDRPHWELWTKENMLYLDATTERRIY